MPTDRIQKIVSQFFSGDDKKRKMAKTVSQMILEDIVTLQKEFREAEGMGCLVFNLENTDDSKFYPIGNVRADISIAEEFNDVKTATFLKQCADMIEKNDDKNLCPVMAVSREDLQLFLVNLAECAQKLEKLSEEGGSRLIL